MPSYYADVCDFMDQAGQEVRCEPTTDVHSEVKTLRGRLIAEECGELLAALNNDDLIEIADGIADVIVVAAGTAAAYGINLDAVWAEVHRSNMSKIADGLKDAGGKVVKGPSYRPPNIRAVLGLADESLLKADERRMERRHEGR